MGLQNIMLLLCGLGLFLYGMKLMGDGLELAAGAKIKSMVERLTKNKYMGALIGIAVTAVIQSSSGTTVMVVGFVNAGIMSLTQAVGVIMGANIGTTFTGILTALKFNTIAPVAIFIGVLMIMFCKKTNKKHIGQIITGFGILFFGMTTMSGAMAPLADSPVFGQLVVQFQNPLFGLLVGTLFTAVIQSSAATLVVLQSLAISGVITLDSAVYVIYGQNIGTCITAILACVGANRTAKRTAAVHLSFNMIGSLLFTLLTLSGHFTRLIQTICPGNIPLQISLVHVVFNVVTTAILLPLSDYLVKMACRIIPGEDKKREAMSLQYLDPRILNTPPVAVAQVVKEVARLAELAKDNFIISMDALFQKDTEKIQILEENESVINYLNQNITEYLVKINSLDLEENDREILGGLFHVVSDYERIGDHSENIGEQAQIIINGKASLSAAAEKELHEMQNLTISILDDSFQLFMAGSKNQDLAFRVNRTEETIDDETDRLKDEHIRRLNNGSCSARSGAAYTDLLINLERIADHATNIAFSMAHTTRAPAVHTLAASEESA